MESSVVGIIIVVVCIKVAAYIRQLVTWRRPPLAKVARFFSYKTASPDTITTMHTPSPLLALLAAKGME